MVSLKLFCALFLLVLLCRTVFADGCAETARIRACSECDFDANGKMDPDCYNNIKSNAITCYAVTYPIAYKNYTEGKCPGIDTCVSNWDSCVNSYKSGNDSEDCKNAFMGACYVNADFCVESAARRCQGLPQVECPLIDLLILLFAVGALFGISGFYT